MNGPDFGRLFLMQLSSKEHSDQSGGLDDSLSPASDLNNQSPLPRWRRHLRWWLAAGIAVVLLALLPPLLNANRYQRQIARSMSLSLGRPVHLDNVSLHLLPMPGLTLSNLVVSEDPAFGAEPTIRANTVEASLRLSSLWRGRVEISTVRFVEPSVNLVRNTAGRWNLADVLLHAAHVNTAPTSQRRAGPAPRFPYIEATGGRVNVKLEQEKLPLSLVAADFALWQPSPHQWRVRLRGQPGRTDANTTDTGSLRIEGDLLQATAAEDVRVDLHANWYDAPLGEASLLITGNDLGWRGHLNLDAQLTGTLSAAQISSKLTLGGLRRAEFAPAHPLDLQLTCSAGISIQTVLLKQLACSFPASAAAPMTLTSPELNLQHPEQTEATVTATSVPNRWALLWAGLFSPRIVTDSSPPGTFDLRFMRSGEPFPGAAPAPQVHAGRSLTGGGSVAPHSAWSGRITETLPAPSEVKVSTTTDASGAPGASETPVVLLFQSAFDQAFPEVFPESSSEISPVTHPDVRLLFRLEPTTIHTEGAASMRIEGLISTVGYSFNVAGTADRAVLTLPAQFLPQLGEGLDAVLPLAAPLPQAAALPPASEAQGAAKVEFTCNAAWGTAQVCAATPGPGKSRAGSASPASTPRSR